MKPFLSSVCLIASGFVSVLMCTSHAAAGWSGLYSPGSGFAYFDEGDIRPVRGGSGYVLEATSFFETEVAFLSRFSESGDPLWSIFLDAGSDAIDVGMAADRDNLDRVFVDYLTDSNTIRLGLFLGASGEPLYAREVAVDAHPWDVDGRLFQGGVSAVVQHFGRRVRILTFDVSGNTIFDKEYKSPLFGLPLDNPDYQFEQNASLDRWPDLSGFLLTVESSVETLSDLEGSVSNSWVIARLNNAGGVMWSDRFALTSAEFFVGSDVTLAPDGSVVLLVVGRGGGTMAGATTRSWVVKWNPNGSFAWATLLENVGLYDLEFGPDSSLFLAGNGPVDDQFELAYEIVRINWVTGELEAKVGLKGSFFTFGRLAGVTGDRVYWSAETHDCLGGPITNVVGYLSLNLDQPVVRRYLDHPDFARARLDHRTGRIIYTFQNYLEGTIGAVSLNQDLEAPVACKLFEDYAMRITDPAIEESSVELALEQGQLTGSNVTSQIAPVHFTLSPWELARTDLCSEPPPAAPALVIGPTPGAATFSVSFDSQAGVNYEVQFSATARGPFAGIESIAGTGGRLSVEVDARLSQQGFVRVRATRP